MSNLGDLLNQITGSQDAAVELAGNVIGTLADMAGAAGAVGGVVSAIGSLIDNFISSDQEILSKLDDLETEIQNDFTALNAELRAQNILTRLNNLDPAKAQVQTVIDQLKDDLSQTPPVDEEYRLQQIGLCLDAVNQFDQDDKWLTNFQDEIYYGSPAPSDPENIPSDNWAGTMAPTPNSDGTVFSDRYILPDFLAALYDFMLVAAAFEGDFATRYQAPLKRFAARLQWAHDTSKQGLATIRTPAQTDLCNPDGTYFCECIWGEGGRIRGSGSVGGSAFTQLINSGGKWPYISGQWQSPYMTATEVLNGPGGPTTPGYCTDISDFLDGQGFYFQEYGVVHLYSGCSSISNYPPIPLPDVTTDVFWARFCASLALANRRNYKQAYKALGLATVWKTINVLRCLTGDPPLGAYDPDVVWTVGEVGKIFGSAFIHPGTPPPSKISLVDVMKGLSTITASLQQTTTGPQPPPPLKRPLSFRDELKKALDAMTFTCTPLANPPEPFTVTF